MLHIKFLKQELSKSSLYSNICQNVGKLGTAIRIFSSVENIATFNDVILFLSNINPLTFKLPSLKSKFQELIHFFKESQTVQTFEFMFLSISTELLCHVPFIK